MNFIENGKNHLEKHCTVLYGMSRSGSILTSLNCALLDRDREKVSQIKEFLSQHTVKYRLEDAARLIRNKSRLRIAYLLPSNEAETADILVEQSRKLIELGHEVILYSHSPRDERSTNEVPFILVHPDNNLSDIVPDSDVVVAGSWDLVIDALRINAPLKYHFAQGGSYIFEFEKLSQRMKDIIVTAFVQPLKILTVSAVMQQSIQWLFGRNSIVVPNALDRSIFYARSGHKSPKKPQILLTGSDDEKSGGHEMVIGTLFSLKELGHKFNIKWITGDKLCKDYSSLGLEITQYASPSPKEAGEIYRESDIYICGSYYEVDARPALEAMACGCAVVTSGNGAVREYAEDGFNCLVFEPGNIIQLAEKLGLVLSDQELRSRLKKGGLATAGKLTWKKTAKIMEGEFKKSAACTEQAYII